MKKVLCVILVLVLCIIPVSLAENTDETIAYEPKIANGVDNTASEWLSTSMDRALLSILLLAELPSDSSIEGTKVLSGTTYIGRSNETCILLGRDNDKFLTVYYTPILKEAMYSISDFPFEGDAAFEFAAEKIISTYDEYYKNVKEDILQCVQLLHDGLNN